MLVNAELNVDQVDEENSSAIADKLNGNDGVLNVDIDLESKTVTVRYDTGKIDLLDIKQMIMEDGYSVMEI